MNTNVNSGERYADSIGALWEVLEVMADGTVRLWNRSYNAFQTVPVGKLKEMKKS